MPGFAAHQQQFTCIFFKEIMAKRLVCHWFSGPKPILRLEIPKYTWWTYYSGWAIIKKHCFTESVFNKEQALNQYTKKPYQYNYNYFQKNVKITLQLQLAKTLPIQLPIQLQLQFGPKNSVNLENLAKFRGNLSMKLCQI